MHIYTQSSENSNHSPRSAEKPQVFVYHEFHPLLFLIIMADAPPGAVKPPNNASSNKAAFAQQIASKKIDEEFEYFVKRFQQLGPKAFDAPEITEYALNPKTDGLLDDGRGATELPAGSKVCIIGAGMAGKASSMMVDKAYC